MVINLENEEWRTVVGYEGYYEVSNYGRVKSLSRIKTIHKGTFVSKEHLLKLKTEKNDNVRVMLQREGIRKTYMVHRLVGFAFIPNPNGLPEINHINRDRTCNLLDNLEWVTKQENMTHCYLKVDKKSSHVGVYFDERYGKWHTCILISEKKRKYLGLFAKEEDGIKAYHEAMIKYGVVNKYAV
jgi:hypothetical protein